VMGYGVTAVGKGFCSCKDKHFFQKFVSASEKTALAANVGSDYILFKFMGNCIRDRYTAERL
jgi:hypothetical protein